MALVVFVSSPEPALGEIPLADALVVDGVRRRGSGFFQGVSRELQEHLAREGVIPGMERVEALKQGVDIVTAGEAGGGGPDGFCPVLVRRSAIDQDGRRPGPRCEGGDPVRYSFRT
jgi:hypothetical protein